jgi:RNA polymerase sigma factor (sigma-70 family)
VEASALQAPVALGRTRASLRTPLLRLRTDEQLVALFRAGHEEAFRVIYDRYRQRLFAYTRQMLPRRQDAEDALQDVFVRAYSGLRANDRELALRAWLYRVAHNRCIDELRRPLQPPPELIQLMRSSVEDPVAAAEERESLRRLVADVRRLPDQQRSALLMRELGGMPYADLAAALGVSVPAIKSLLVRARVALAQALEARDTACAQIRDALSLAHDRGVRPGATARRHMRDCPGCREFRHELRGVSRRFAALAPALGPLGALAKVLGLGGGAGGAASGGSAAAGGVVGTGGVVASGALASGAGHVATLIAATVVTAGGAMEIQRTITAAPQHHHHVRVTNVRSAPSEHRAQSLSAASAPATAGARQPPSAAADLPGANAAPVAASTPAGGSKSKGAPAAATGSADAGKAALGGVISSVAADAIGQNGAATTAEAIAGAPGSGVAPTSGNGAAAGSTGPNGAQGTSTGAGASANNQPGSTNAAGSVAAQASSVASPGLQPSSGGSGASGTNGSAAPTR